jgi:putative flippase GtrA
MTEETNIIDELAHARRIRRFVSIGAVGFCFDVATATALSEFGLFPELAALIGIEISVVIMFLLNDNITFATEGLAGIIPTFRRLLKSNLVRIGGITVQLLVFSGFYRGINVTFIVASVDAWFIVSKVAGVGVGMIVNYVAESLFTWRITQVSD